MALAKRLVKAEQLVLLIDQTLAQVENQVQQLIFRPLQPAPREFAILYCLEKINYDQPPDFRPLTQSGGGEYIPVK